MRAKALQIQSGFMDPRKTANNGLVQEYGLSFNITPLPEEPDATKRIKHPLWNDAGAYYAPDTPHGCNHGKYAGLTPV